MIEFVNKLLNRHHSVRNSLKHKYRLKPTDSFSCNRKSYYLMPRCQNNNVKSVQKITPRMQSAHNRQQKRSKKKQFYKVKDIKIREVESQVTAKKQEEGIQKYIEQWKLLNKKINKKWNEVSYNNKFSNVTIRTKYQIQKNKQLIEKQKRQVYNQIKFNKDFNLIKYKSILKFNSHNLNLQTQLNNYHQLLAANTFNQNYITVQIEPSNDYTNYLKQIAHLLNASELTIEANIYFCILMGENVDPYSFFWVGIPVVHYNRTLILTEIKRFLGNFVEDKNQDLTIWIVDWGGRVSFVKYHLLLKQDSNNHKIGKKQQYEILMKRKWNQRSIIGLKKIVETVE